MRISVIVAAHNEGQALTRTVASCVETCGGLDYEIVVADDASHDGSVDAARREFPRLRVVRHDQRQGAAAAKSLGAEQARGEVLVFLDGHTKPEDGAISRLVESVEWLDGQCVVTPRIPALNVERWTNCEHQVGQGYRLDLEQFDCGWLGLARMREIQSRGRRFYESPALIGCALAVSRQLYAKLWGFDAGMRIWGVEDLDFGLKCWLMGHPILHDLEATIGHRFRQRFDNYSVPIEHLVANQLRMARKNFTPGAWSAWLDRFRQRHPGRLPDHPEGLWARVWQLFEEGRPSAEREHSYLMAHRHRDEFWYAERFDLAWPRLQSESSAAPLPASLQAFAEPSPSPPPCNVTGVVPEQTHVCVGTNVTFTAQGSGLENVAWTTSPAGNPATGQGAQFTTRWNTVGALRQATARCDDSSATGTALVSGVDKIVVQGSDPPDLGPKAICLGETINLDAWSDPNAFGFPGNQPVWEIVEQPEGSQVPNPPSGARAVSITPTHQGLYRVQASCGTSTATFDVLGIRVTLPAKIVTGFTDPPEQLNIAVEAIAQVEPASAVEQVEISVGGPVPGRVEIVDLFKVVNGEIHFRVKGKTATPSDKPQGDTAIVAKVNGVVCAQAPAIVVIPKTLTPISANGPVQGVNQAADKTTSPAYAGPLADGAVHLWTYYVHWLLIVVSDQFGNTLAPCYDGAQVAEALGEVAINQQIRGVGTYLDPVGVVYHRQPKSNFQWDDPIAQGWPNEPPIPLANSDHTQNIPVYVGGHALTPGIVNRRVITTAGTNNVQIIWQ